MGLSEVQRNSILSYRTLSFSNICRCALVIRTTNLSTSKRPLSRASGDKQGTGESKITRSSLVPSSRLCPLFLNSFPTFRSFWFMKKPRLQNIFALYNKNCLDSLGILIVFCFYIIRSCIDRTASGIVYVQQTVNAGTSQRATNLFRQGKSEQGKKRIPHPAVFARKTIHSKGSAEAFEQIKLFLTLR